MPRLLPLVLTLVLVPGLRAQLSVGGASIFSGQEVIYRGSATGPPESKEVGVGLQLDPIARALDEGRGRFEVGTCPALQVAVEAALRAHRDAHALDAFPRPSHELLTRLVQEERLAEVPRDPESDASYSWWRYAWDATGEVRCLDHGPFRERLED